MSRKEIIALAEKLGLLYPEPTSSSDYGHPQHQRFISKLEKFAEGCYDRGIAHGWNEANERSKV